MASQSRKEPRNRFPSPSPVLAPLTRAAMSTISNPVYTSFLEFDILPRRSTRSSGTCARATAVSVVENGCGATMVEAPVSALNKLDLPLFGRPTRPSRSTTRQATGASHSPVRSAGLHGSIGVDPTKAICRVDTRFAEVVRRRDLLDAPDHLTRGVRRTVRNDEGRERGDEGRRHRRSAQDPVATARPDGVDRDAGSRAAGPRAG